MRAVRRVAGNSFANSMPSAGTAGPPPNPPDSMGLAATRHSIASNSGRSNTKRACNVYNSAPWARSRGARRCRWSDTVTAPSLSHHGWHPGSHGTRGAAVTRSVDADGAAMQRARQGCPSDAALPNASDQRRDHRHPRRDRAPHRTTGLSPAVDIAAIGAFAAPGFIWSFRGLGPMRPSPTFPLATAVPY